MYKSEISLWLIKRIIFSIIGKQALRRNEWMFQIRVARRGGDVDNSRRVHFRDILSIGRRRVLQQADRAGQSGRWVGSGLYVLLNWKNCCFWDSFFIFTKVWTLFVEIANCFTKLKKCVLGLWRLFPDRF